MSSDCLAHSVGVMQTRSKSAKVPARSVLLQTIFSGAAAGAIGFGGAREVAHCGSFQVISPSCVFVCDGPRFGSDLNTAFIVTTLQVSSSRSGWPLLCVTWHRVTSPLLSSVTVNP